ncbi:MAG: YIP1 family protein [Candidatus Margulisbacteria bacterium]|nr:YIP1 family protein [Candidatus Margulisiibacteriota bacterium]MBU1022327.1 YIP1 family protein [Candidatus Margulisiibacteriota bacterium]MBU1729577.1 YIP1 family protein [Candidatus Margulisiibacteriota bacterium]MBU1955063.1 YIP1 family protein [Candidatus Margulisiibacteriota bacterium]
MFKKIVDRAKEIILKPMATWPIIKNEETSITLLFTNYAAILAAIPSLAMIIGYSIIGMQVPMAGTFRMPLQDSLLAAVLNYVLSLVGVYIGGYVINYLAPHFESKSNLSNAMKLVVYAATPVWLAGVFSVIPSLSILAIIGLYGVYLLYIGLPILMETPAEKTLPYIVAAIVVAIIVMVVVNILVGQFIYAPVYSRISPY